jgi:beta-galactosidase
LDRRRHRDPDGFRTLRFDADKGFFLNDQHVKLQGVCIHQDHAGVGVAVPEAIWEFRLRRLKEMGVNAIRFSHNAPAAEVLDMATAGLARHGREPQLQSLARLHAAAHLAGARDRNHPSVILWSVFNEEPMQGTEPGYEMVRRMVAAVKALDITRPVTAAMNGGLFTDINVVSQAVDVVGFNYQIGSYDAFHKANPNLPMTQLGRHLGLHDARRVQDRPGRTSSAYDDERPTGAIPTARPGRPSPSGPSWPAASSGPASTTAANPRPTSGPASAPSSARWTCAASPRRPSGSTRRSG